MPKYHVTATTRYTIYEVEASDPLEAAMIVKGHAEGDYKVIETFEHDEEIVCNIEGLDPDDHAEGE